MKISDQGLVEQTHFRLPDGWWFPAQGRGMGRRMVRTAWKRTPPCELSPQAKTHRPASQVLAHQSEQV